MTSLEMGAKERKKNDDYYEDEDGEDDVDLEDVVQTDPIIKILGEMGRWQMGLYLITSLSIVIHAWAMLVNKFLTFPTDYWCYKCAQPAELSGISKEEWINISTPILDGSGLPDKCHVFDVDYAGKQGVIARPTTDDTRACTAWEYDDSVIQRTVVHRFDLVCDDAPYVRLGQTIFFVGTFFGVFVSGFMSDRIGRMMSYRIWLAIWVIAGVLGAFAPNFWLWAICRFFVGGASIAYNTCATVFCVEQAGNKWRSYTNSFFRALPFSIGYLTLGLVGYVIPDMKHLELFIGFSGVPFFIISLFLPESPRWLLVQGRKKEAIAILEKACKMNKRPIRQEDIKALDLIKNESGASGNMTILFRYPGMRRNTILMCFAWMTFSMAYFGLIYNIPSYDMNPFLAFSLGSIVGMPLLAIYPFVENKSGRKIILTGSLTVSGVFLLLTICIPKGAFSYNWPIILLSYLGLMFAGIAFGSGYSFTRELFPTFLRGSSLSLASSFARIGAILSPSIAAISVGDPGGADEILPGIIYGLFNLASGLASVWIWPETRDVKLPDSLEECEDLARTRNTWLRCGAKRRKRKGKVTPE